ncbi:MAG: hypothetical protein JWO67_1052 [Streptosporangiaceae bacterium]|nr:hypothetical protein [Streptosporangiaceae bacterium]
MTAVELDYVCDVCGRLVADNEGSLYVRDVDLQARRVDAGEWQCIHGGGPVSLAELFSHPAVAVWMIGHDRCRPPESEGYHIAVEQVRTWRDLLRWTAHLMPKTWLPDTNWGSVIGAAAEGRDRRIVAVDVRGEVA